ncbi:hypothetical protein [Leptolyngbya sp. FACHB-261]|nr:hypothetical protein [Leptolyngbya sp. FACHB-261]MBD2102694.1 hypothetical protein [Leptolyngbya sp. FACHB-261]
MFNPDSIRSVFLAQSQQPLMGRAVFLGAELAARWVAAVRIPGGLTPP